MRIAAFLLAFLACTTPALAAITVTVAGSGGSNSATSPTTKAISVTVTPGDLVYGFQFTSSGGANCSTGSTMTDNNSGTWTRDNTVVCSSGRNTYYVYHHIAQSGDTTYTCGDSFSAGTGYQSCIFLDIAGALTSSPLDNISTFTGGTSATTVPGAPFGTPSQSGDLAIELWGTAYQPATGIACSSPCTGTWTFVSNDPTGIHNALGYQVIAGTTVNGPTSSPNGATYGVAPTSIQIGSLLINPAPAGASVNELATLQVGGPHVPSPNPTPTPQPFNTPPPFEQDAWWNGYAGVTDNKATSLSQVNMYMAGCTGAGQTTGAGTPDVTACELPGIYFRSNAVFPCYTSGGNCSGGIGGESSLPYHIGLTAVNSTCPSAATSNIPFFKQNPVAIDATSTSTAVNAFTYPVTAPVGSSAGIGVGYGYSGGQSYNVFINMDAASVQSYTNSVVQGCYTATGSAANGTKTAINNYKFFFNDNTVCCGLFVFGGGSYSGYDQNKNWGACSATLSGTCAGSTFASWGCNGGLPSMWSGTQPCTGARLSSATNPQGPCYDTAADNDQCYINFWNAIKHTNGTPMLFNGNGDVWTTDVQLVNSPHSIGGTAEELVVGFCAITDTWTATSNPCYSQGDNGIPGEIDALSAMHDNAPTKRYFMLSDAPNLGCTVRGGSSCSPSGNGGTTCAAGAGGCIAGSPQQSAAQQWNLRIQWGLLYLMSDDVNPTLEVSWTNFEESACCGFTTYVDSWPGGFFRPFQRVGETYPSDPTPASGNCSSDSALGFRGSGKTCTVGGAHDPILAKSGTGGTCTTEPNCVFVAGFNHGFIQSTDSTCPGNAGCPDLTKWPGSWTWDGSSNTLSDLGATCVIVNASGAAITLSSTNLANLCPNWAALTASSNVPHVLLQCNPNANYLNTSGSGAVYVMTNPQQLVCSGNTGQDAANGGVLNHDQLITPLFNETLVNGDTFTVTHN